MGWTKYIAVCFICIFSTQVMATEALLDMIVPPTKTIQPSNEVTCYWLKREYANCAQSSGWLNTDVFGFYLDEDPDKNNTRSHRDTLSMCNNISMYLRESGCL